MTKEGGPAFLPSPEQDVVERQFVQDKYGDQVVTFRGMTGTISDLAEKGCPIDLTNVEPEKIERYTINIMNSSGAEIDPEDEQKFRDTLEVQGKEFNMKIREISQSVEGVTKAEDIKKNAVAHEQTVKKSSQESMHTPTVRQESSGQDVAVRTIDTSPLEPKQVPELPSKNEEVRADGKQTAPLEQVDYNALENIANQAATEQKAKVDEELPEQHIRVEVKPAIEVQSQEENISEEAASIELFEPSVLDKENLISTEKRSANIIDAEDTSDELSNLWYELNKSDIDTESIDENEEAAMKLGATADYLVEEDVALISEAPEPEGQEQEPQASFTEDLEQAVAAFEAEASPEDAGEVEKLYQELTQIAEFIAELREGQATERLVAGLVENEAGETTEINEVIEHAGLQGITEEQLVSRLEIVCEQLLDKLEIEYDKELIQLIVAELLKPKAAEEQDFSIENLSAEEREKLGMHNYKYRLTFTQLQHDMADIEARLQAYIGKVAVARDDYDLAA